MKRIVVNYRKTDSPAYAGRLHGWLSDRYGRAQVFMDVETMQHGADFADAIARVVRSADLMLVIIGREWLQAVDAEGRRRLDDPDDYVRIEIEAALASNIRVMPILVGEARMPDRDDLPSSLAMLNHRQAFHLSDWRWRSDMDELGRTLDIFMASDSSEDQERGRSSAPSESWFHALAEKLRVGRRRSAN